METDRLVLERRRLPDSVEVGSELELVIKGRVRRIEADHIDITGFARHPSIALAVLEGEVYVEFTILDVDVL